MRLTHFCAWTLCLGLPSCANRQKVEPAVSNTAAPTLPYSPQALKVVDFDAGPAAVGQPLSGSMTIRNTGPAYKYPVYVVKKDGTPVSGHRVEGVSSPEWELAIFDANNQLLFKSKGGWGSGMAKDQERKLSWNTKHNHVGEVSDGLFLIPGAGNYKVTVAVFAGTKPNTQLDTFTTHLNVSATTQPVK